MPRLIVHGFCCILSADIELGRLTILIGPQASGKSVISKLIYFLYDALDQQFRSIEDDKGFDQFKSDIVEDFKKWFPPSAWGADRFVITFVAGAYEVRMTRQAKKGGARLPKDKVNIQFSPLIEEQYNSLLHAWRDRKTKASDDTATTKLAPTDEFRLYWKLRETSRKALAEALKEEYVEHQLFVPAGRSFFTSVGKAIAAFEHAGMLDPVTAEFGRTFSVLREQGRSRYGGSFANKVTTTNPLVEEFFGGPIKFERETEYVETSDGRRLPFSHLSSGQQELLPLWLALNYYLPESDNFGRALIFIEEPEAHLFPSAQVKLTEYLASMLVKSRAARMFITTHSPYVLAHVNNLIKAGRLASEYPSASQTINKIVPKAAWLPREAVRAYAIQNRRSNSIISDDLIEASYLDEVSGEVAEIFSKLLEVEVTSDT